VGSCPFGPPSLRLASSRSEQETSEGGGTSQDKEGARREAGGYEAGYHAPCLGGCSYLCFGREFPHRRNHLLKPHKQSSPHPPFGSIDNLNFKNRTNDTRRTRPLAVSALSPSCGVRRLMRVFSAKLGFRGAFSGDWEFKAGRSDGPGCENDTNILCRVLRAMDCGKSWSDSGVVSWNTGSLQRERSAVDGQPLWP
jgi:hypothetical protein